MDFRKYVTLSLTFGIRAFFELKNTFLRTQELLNLNSIGKKFTVSVNSAMQGNIVIYVMGYSGSWKSPENSENPDLCLTNINLKIKKGTLNVIIGPNGAGKSSLIYGLIGELPYSRVS